MGKYYIFKDGTLIAETQTREDAISLVGIYQSKENHFMLRSDFSVIHGEMEYVPYTGKKKKRGVKK